ncbi:unnamed protein product [Miscanthus lutarioriparius]|uniref:Dof zinc finger protein n=1 Tax=Miscanthus lutarioriparius TaxID=422564 RepID=A0A811SIV0_9POAL|nr:unnamed protein product [Miscanthus lutarioriparius]
MIFPPVFLVSTSWNSNQKLQQATTTSNINIPSASAVVAGEGNLLQYRQAMAAEALYEGGGSRDARQAAEDPKARARAQDCDSTSTEFCYFNNYSFAQLRHYCRNCHRYWTRGGNLRDIPVGAPYRRRRAKGSKPTAAATAASASSAALVMTSSCTTNVVPLAPTPQQATASSSASPLLPQLYGLASMDTPKVGSKFSWPGAANLLVDSVGGRAVSESKMEQLWGTLSQSSQMHKLPVFSHAIDQQQGPPVAVPVTMTTPPSMFHPGLWSGGDGGIYSGGKSQFHMIKN